MPRDWVYTNNIRMIHVTKSLWVQSPEFTTSQVSLMDSAHCVYIAVQCEDVIHLCYLVCCVNLSTPQSAVIPSIRFIRRFVLSFRKVAFQPLIVSDILIAR